MTEKSGRSANCPECGGKGGWETTAGGWGQCRTCNPRGCVVSRPDTPLADLLEGLPQWDHVFGRDRKQQ